MATVVNNPQPQNSDSGFWNFLGLLVLIIAFFILIVYGLPFIRSSIGVSQIKVPEKIDVNVNQTK